MGPGGAAGPQVGTAPSRWAPGKRGALDALGPPDDADGGGAGGGFGAAGAGNAGGCGLGGFRTAKSQLVADCARKGQPPPAFVNQVRWRRDCCPRVRRLTEQRPRGCRGTCSVSAS